MESPKQAGSESDQTKDHLDLGKIESVQMGTVSKQKKPFTLLAAAALGYSTTNTSAGILLSVGSTAFGAGPLFFYGTLLIACVAFCVAISLGELSSAFPHVGGQYYWVAQLAPPKFRRFLSYMTAIISWASVVCIGASCAAATTNIFFQLYSFTRPDFVYKQWMGFLAFEAINIVGGLFNIYERPLPGMVKGFTLFSLAVAIAFFIALFAAGSEKQSAAVVFGAGEYFNVSGWHNGMAFLIGISAINWSFSCLDAVTHLAEEISDPRRNIPKALLSTVGIGLVFGLAMSLAIFFVAVDLPNTTSVITLLYEIYDNNPTPALVLGSVLLLTGWSSLVGIHTWQARIAMAIGRDEGFPFHAHISKLAPSPYHTPLWAHLWSSSWIGLCGFLYLGSLTAFNSFIAVAIILQYQTYAAPIILLLMYGRKNIEQGPFWWPKFGLVANVVVVAWTLLITVIFCFPFDLPVEATSMNYVAVVLVLIFAYAGGYWAFYGHKHFRLVKREIQLD